jgi:hypothetical protein
MDDSILVLSQKFRNCASAGAHEVRLTSAPLSFRIGAALTLLSAIALGAVLAVENMRWIRTRDTVTVR